MDKRDYFQYGSLKIPVMGGLHSFDGKKGHDYAEYSLASGKNLSKPVGQQLRTISIGVMLRSILGDDIRGIIDTIDKMITLGEAYDLIFIDGFYKGKYYITSCSDILKKTMPTGELLEYDFTLNLQEFEDRVVLTETVQKNPKHKAVKKSTISQRQKTKQSNSKMPVNKKLKK